MFQVLNSNNEICFCSEDFNKAKQIASEMKEELAENFSIIETKQVWSTQTLDEALKSS